MATILFTRTNQYANRLRSYRILINGQEHLRLRHNENKSITLAAGTYTICAKIDWASSQEYEVTLEEQGNTTLEIGCSMTSTTPQKIMDVLGFAVLFWSIL